jgi:hypothetical protein
MDDCSENELPEGEFPSGASGAQGDDNAEEFERNMWPTAHEPYGNLLAEWKAFSTAGREKLHLWAPASNLQRLKKFRCWLSIRQWEQCATFQALLGLHSLNLLPLPYLQCPPAP